jgi:hypothetical protein
VSLNINIMIFRQQRITCVANGLNLSLGGLKRVNILWHFVWRLGEI